MPAKSQAQFRFMKAVASGAIKQPGLSKKEAEEYTSENKGKKSYKKLAKKIVSKSK